MKIALLIPDKSNTAPNLVARELAFQYKTKGHQVNLFYFRDCDEIIFPVIGIKIKLFGCSDFLSYDIVHSHMLRADLHVKLSQFLKKKTKTKFVSTIHNMVELDNHYQYGRLKSIFLSKIWRWAWSAFDELVVLTHAAENYYTKFIPSRKTVVIPNGRTPAEGVDLNSEDHIIITNLRRKYSIIGSCALLTNRKGLDQIIRALPLLSNFAFVLIGDGAAKQNLLDLARELGVLDRCIFFGFKHNAQSFLPYFDIYGMPSRSEGLPLALLEAAAHHKSIICSDIPVFREIFDETEVSFFQIDDVKNIADVILHALAYRDSYGEAAFSKYKIKYTAEKMADKYLELFSSICCVKV